MRSYLRKWSIYGVSAFLSLTMFATTLSAAPRVPRDGDPWTWVRVVGRLAREICDILSLPK
jgi:hypothetical protein